MATPLVPLFFSPQPSPSAACAHFNKLLSNDVLMTTDARRCRDASMEKSEDVKEHEEKVPQSGDSQYIARMLQPFVIGNCTNL